MKLSIITINFNNLAGLKRTYESVVCQTWTDYEWIVIDGGSTDGSSEFIEQHQDKFAYWCSEPDKGIYNAMNKGIDCAKGEYLIFMNSGDYFFNKNVLLDVSGLIADADIILFRTVRMDNGELVRNIDKNIVKQLLIDTIDHQSSFIKKTLFNVSKYDETLRIVSDWKFWIEAIIWREATVRYHNIVVAIMDTTGISSISSPQYGKLIAERKEVINDLIPPLLLKELRAYWALQDNEYVKRSKYLFDNSLTLYRLGRRLLFILVQIVKGYQQVYNIFKRSKQDSTSLIK